LGHEKIDGPFSMGTEGLNKLIRKERKIAEQRKDKRPYTEEGQMAKWSKDR
jgi:hypothetical protein